MLLFQGDAELVEEECWVQASGEALVRPARSSARGSEMRRGAAGAVGRGQQRLPYRAEHPQRNCRNGPLALGQN